VLAGAAPDTVPRCPCFHGSPNAVTTSGSGCEALLSPLLMLFCVFKGVFLCTAFKKVSKSGLDVPRTAENALPAVLTASGLLFYLFACGEGISPAKLPLPFFPKAPRSSTESRWRGHYSACVQTLRTFPAEPHLQLVGISSSLCKLNVGGAWLAA